MKLGIVLTKPTLEILKKKHNLHSNSRKTSPVLWCTNSMYVWYMSLQFTIISYKKNQPFMYIYIYIYIGKYYQSHGPWMVWVISQLPTWPTVTKSRFQIRVIYPIKVNLSQSHGWCKNRYSSLVIGAVISLVSRWPREFLGDCRHPPWGIFTIELGGIPQKPPIPVVIPRGTFTKMDPSARVFQYFFVGWDPSEQEMLAFLLIMGALLVDSDIVIDRYCNSFIYWDCSMLKETFLYIICLFACSYHYTINAYIEPHWIMYQSIYIHLESGVFAIKLRYSFIQTGILSKIWTWVRWPWDLPSLKLT